MLDATILSGAVATLGWLIIGGSEPSSGPLASIPRLYPILDLVLLMILVNMLLANRKARRTLFLWGLSLLAVLVSDFAYSLLASSGSYQAGGPESLGWTAGGLLFAIGVVAETDSPPTEGRLESPGLDIGASIQNILPVTFVLALFWFVISQWQLRGELSVLGLLMSLLLALALIVRMGVRAGEAELHKYWQLFSSLAEPAFICDARGKILFGNPAFARAMGLPDVSQLAGKPLTAVFQGQRLPANLLERASRSEHSREVILQPHRTAYLLSVSPFMAEGGRILIAGVAYNLREQKRQQQAVQKAYDELQEVYRRLEALHAELEHKVEERTQTLTQAYRQLEEQNKMLQVLDQLKSDFVSMVSHELRTPLTSIGGGLELLLGSRHLGEADRSTLSLMRKEVQRLTRFVENILSLSTMEAGRLETHPVALSLPKILEDVRGSFQAVDGVDRIRVRIPHGLPLVLADETLLRSVLNHLLDNALKYAPRGEVRLEAVRGRGRIRVQVTDSGPGIPADQRKLLFKRFQRLDPRDSQTVYGYGLGLYLSRRMLRAMRSDLLFESPEQGGARFYFHLRAAK
jgi:signal transduction histidine kinase